MRYVPKQVMPDQPDTLAEIPNLWSSARRGGAKKCTAIEGASTRDERYPFEHDYDRLLFSTPVRRMADKTQVFPLERNDSVRTRLTHSHEVSNLARSIGNRLVRTSPEIFGSPIADQAAPVILATVGLAHDLGNPPFGHQGETAIRRWFHEQQVTLFGTSPTDEVPPEFRRDFLNFEGNAHTLRLITRLQVSSGGFGLDLTAATLAALMKYTAPSNRAGDLAPRKTKATSKPGFFASEKDIVSWITQTTGLKEGERHPLTWLMEACDDIAYSVLDIEDAIKKSIISPEDVLAYLKRLSANEIPQALVRKLEEDFAKADTDRRASRASEIKTSYLRTRLIECLITGAADAFLVSRDAIFEQRHTSPLLEGASSVSPLYTSLKSFARAHAYNHPSVLRTELQGAVAISKLMDWFWKAIHLREDAADPTSRRKTAFAAYAYALISDNYRVEFEERARAQDLPLRYCELQLLTDMISGMTDGFVMETFNDLEPLSHA